MLCVELFACIMWFAGAVKAFIDGDLTHAVACFAAGYAAFKGVEIRRLEYRMRHLA